MIAMTRGGPVVRLAMVVWIVEWGGIASGDIGKWNSWEIDMKNSTEVQGEKHIYANVARCSSSHSIIKADVLVVIMEMSELGKSCAKRYTFWA